MSVCLFVCPFVPKYLANCLTDMVLLHNVASHRSTGKVYNYFGGRYVIMYHNTTKKNALKYACPPHPPPSLPPKYAPRGL